MIVGKEINTIIGKGAFGVVYHVEEKEEYGNERKEYALKKVDLRARPVVGDLYSEVNLAPSLDSPFIVKIHGAFIKKERHNLSLDIWMDYYKKTLDSHVNEMFKVNRYKTVCIF